MALSFEPARPRASTASRRLRTAADRVRTTGRIRTANRIRAPGHVATAGFRIRRIDSSMNLRSHYEQAVRDLRRRAAHMQSEGAPAETIARAVHAERRRLVSLFREQTPEPYRTRIRERTQRVYGDELGPTIEFLRAKGRSWEAITESAMRPGRLIEPGDARDAEPDGE
ncbi:MAG: hypothetical protein QM766_10865 [Burkholderiaceae bacterium]